MFKKLLIKEIVKIILECVRREKGRLTRISNTCNINRGKFTTEGIAGMRVSQFILLFFAICLNLTEKEFEAMMKEIYHTIVDKSAEYDFTIFKEDTTEDNSEDEKKK